MEDEQWPASPGHYRERGVWAGSCPGESASEGGWTGGPGHDRAPPGASGAVRQGDANLTEDTFLP